MLKRIYLKLKLPDEDLIHSLAKIIYLNVFTISRFYIFELDLEKNVIQSENLEKSGDFQFKILRGEQIKQFLPRGIDLPREFYIHQIDNVEYCVVALKDDIIAHIFWLYEKDNPSRCFKLKANEVCINYAYTFPEYRGNRLYPRGILFAAHYLQQKGYSRILTVAHEGTINTLASYRKINGLEKVAELKHWFIVRPKYSS